MKLFWILFDLFFDLIRSVLCAYFVCVSAAPRTPWEEKKKPFAIVAASLFLTSVVVMFFGSLGKIALIACVAIPFAAAYFFFSKNIVKDLIISVIPFISICIGSIAATNIVTFATGKSMIEFSDSDSFPQMILVFISTALTAVIMIVVAKVIQKTDADMSRAELAVIALSIIMSLAAVILIYFFAIRGSSDRTKNFILSLVILFMTALYIAGYSLILRIILDRRQKAESTPLRQFDGGAGFSKDLSNQYESISKMRHDLKNTLGIIDCLIQSGKIDEALSYISECVATFRDSIVMIDTHNEYLNAIVNYKCAKAKEEGVDVSVCTASDIEFPDNTDLCSLIGNMFDNAITAAKECDGGNISLDIHMDNSELNISMVNTVRAPVLADNPELTSTKGGDTHGLGTKIIRDIAEKYDGSVDFYDTLDGKFCCSVILYPEGSDA